MELKTKIGSLNLSNPVMSASGCFGNGKEISEFIDLNKMGAIVCKTVTLNARAGNPSPRIADYPYGMLNAIGLENDGLKQFLSEDLPFVKQFNAKAIASISAENKDEFIQMVQIINKDNNADAIEVNLSCPNISHGKTKGLFAQDKHLVYEITSSLKKETNIPIFIKLSPNVSDIVEIAHYVKKADGDAIVLINTISAMGVDIEQQKPLLGNITGGLSGACLKPIALKMIWDVYNNIDIPIIGLGGISTWQDAIEFILCGASAFEVGTANFSNPNICIEILDKIQEYCTQKDINSLIDIRGKLKV